MKVSDLSFALVWEFLWYLIASFHKPCKIANSSFQIGNFFRRRNLKRFYATLGSCQHKATVSLIFDALRNVFLEILPWVSISSVGTLLARHFLKSIKVFLPFTNQIFAYTMFPCSSAIIWLVCIFNAWSLNLFGTSSALAPLPLWNLERLFIMSKLEVELFDSDALWNHYTAAGTVVHGHNKMENFKMLIFKLHLNVTRCISWCPMFDPKFRI